MYDYCLTLTEFDIKTDYLLATPPRAFRATIFLVIFIRLLPYEIGKRLNSLSNSDPWMARYLNGYV